MEGNILTSPPETQPQSSTGISESREACIQYTRVTCAVTKERKWRVLQHELHNQLSGLMSLIVKQSQQSPQHGTTQSSKNNRQRASKIETVAKESLVQVTKDKKHDLVLSPGNEGAGFKPWNRCQLLLLRKSQLLADKFKNCCQLLFKSQSLSDKVHRCLGNQILIKQFENSKN